jgi:hypothetical protein
VRQWGCTKDIDKRLACSIPPSGYVCACGIFVTKKLFHAEHHGAQRPHGETGRMTLVYPRAFSHTVSCAPLRLPLQSHPHARISPRPVEAAPDGAVNELDPCQGTHPRGSTSTTTYVSMGSGRPGMSGPPPPPKRITSSSSTSSSSSPSCPSCWFHSRTRTHPDSIISHATPSQQRHGLAVRRNRDV